MYVNLGWMKIRLCCRFYGSRGVDLHLRDTMIYLLILKRGFLPGTGIPDCLRYIVLLSWSTSLDVAGSGSSAGGGRACWPSRELGHRAPLWDEPGSLPPCARAKELSSQCLATSLHSGCCFFFVIRSKKAFPLITVWCLVLKICMISNLGYGQEFIN